MTSKLFLLADSYKLSLLSITERLLLLKLLLLSIFLLKLFIINLSKLLKETFDMDVPHRGISPLISLFYLAN